MRIVTYNVNSIRARLERFCDFLSRDEADVLCLQETKVQDEDFPFAEVEACGYRSVVHGQKTYNGVAILAREEIEILHRGLAPETEEAAQARLIAGAVGDFDLWCLYVPNGKEVGDPAYDYKLRWLERLREVVASGRRPGRPTLLLGDFNIAPDDRDVHDPEAWRGRNLFSEPEHAALRALCELGFEDLFRRFHEEGGLFSWWDYRQLAFPKNRGLRIDLILGDEEAARRCEAVEIVRAERKGKKPSDHAPVRAVFR